MVCAREHLSDDPPLHLALGVLALGRDGVDLVNEEQRRRLLGRDVFMGARGVACCVACCVVRCVARCVARCALHGAACSLTSLKREHYIVQYSALHGAACSLASLKREHYTVHYSALHGAACSLASLKRERILASLSPDMPETTSGAEILRKATPSSPAR